MTRHRARFRWHPVLYALAGVLMVGTLLLPDPRMVEVVPGAVVFVAAVLQDGREMGWL